MTTNVLLPPLAAEKAIVETLFLAQLILCYRKVKDFKNKWISVLFSLSYTSVRAALTYVLVSENKRHLLETVEHKINSTWLISFDLNKCKLFGK